MEFETVFEMSTHPFPTIAVMCGIFFCATVLFLYQQYKTYREKGLITAGQRIILFLCFLLCMVAGAMFVGVAKDKQEQRFADQYYSGDYEVVEGDIKDYNKVKMGMVEFFVEDEDFVFQYFMHNPVPQEGYVKISFVRDANSNEIMKIEVAKE